MKSIILPLLLFFSYVLHGQEPAEAEVYRTTVTYTPSENGYEVQLPIAYKFINCYGEVLVTITKDNQSATTSAYIYKGIRYTSAEVGSSWFEKPEVGYTDVSADLYDQSFRLGRVKMNNLIDWLGGCFGQTYDVLKQVGATHQAYKDKLTSLRLSNITVDNCATRDFKLESKLEELAKATAAKDLISKADAALSRGDLEEAEQLYKQAQGLSAGDTHIQQQLEIIREKKTEAANEAAYEAAMKRGNDALAQGKYEEAKQAFQQALQRKPGDSDAKNSLEKINEQLKKEAEAAKESEEQEARRDQAVSAAANQRHKGTMWGENIFAASHGSGTQNSTLMGLVRVDYDISTMAGEPVYSFRFYWEWDDALNTGYPQYASVLVDTVVMIKELQQFPDLWERWNQVKPLYVELESDVLYFKKGEDFTAQEGTIRIIPEVIGRSGEQVGWSQPASCSWEELFPYCNYLDWGYFRLLGLDEEISAYADQFGTERAWPKYVVQYSDDINFYQSHKWFPSKYLTLTQADYQVFSTSLDVVKIVWPVKEIQDIIRDYEKMRKIKAEDTMEVSDFWNTPENEETLDNEADFWDMPENALTVQEQQEQTLDYQTQQMLSNWPVQVGKRRERLLQLRTPISIKSQSEVTNGNPSYTLEGSVADVFAGRMIKIIADREEYWVDVSPAGSFRQVLKLKPGINRIRIQLMETKFSSIPLKEIPFSISFKPELDGEGTVTTRNAKISVVDFNAAQDDYYDLYLNGVFVGDVNNSPGGSTTINVVLEPGDNFIELRLDREMGSSTRLKIIINDGEFEKEFSGSKDHKYIISAPYDE